MDILRRGIGSTIWIELGERGAKHIWHTVHYSRNNNTLTSEYQFLSKIDIMSPLSV